MISMSIDHHICNNDSTLMNEKRSEFSIVHVFPNDDSTCTSHSVTWEKYITS